MTIPVYKQYNQWCARHHLHSPIFLNAHATQHLMIWYYTLAATRRSNGYRLAIWGVVIRLCQAVSHAIIFELILTSNPDRLA